MLQRLKHELFHKHNHHYEENIDLFYIEDNHGEYTIVMDHDFMHWLEDEHEFIFSEPMGKALGYLEIVMDEYWEELLLDNRA